MRKVVLISPIRERYVQVGWVINVQSSACVGTCKMIWIAQDLWEWRAWTLPKWQKCLEEEHRQRYTRQSLGAKDNKMSKILFFLSFSYLAHRRCSVLRASVTLLHSLHGMLERKKFSFIKEKGCPRLLTVFLLHTVFLLISLIYTQYFFQFPFFACFVEYRGEWLGISRGKIALPNSKYDTHFNPILFACTLRWKRSALRQRGLWLGSQWTRVK